MLMAEDRQRTIGCLGWGSLIWDRRDLPIRGTWFDDGPLLPIEFARESSNRRITLVICPVNDRVRACWTLMETGDLGTAKRCLAAREGIEEKDIERVLGFWEAASGNFHGAAAEDIAKWAQTKSLDAVVWTNLEFGLKARRGTLPSLDDILNHLRRLPDAQRRLAEEYIRNAPAQIDTLYRRRIEGEFGWYCERSSRFLRWPRPGCVEDPIGGNTSVSIRSLHPNHQRIVSALQAAVRILQMTEHLTIVGSLGRFLAGENQWVGDIDVLINSELCKRYWNFLEILALHGVRSVYDVFDRPQFPWKPCRQQIAHARALTVDCHANVLMSVGMKHANLDVCFKAADLDAIPHSSRWVDLFDPNEMRAKDQEAIAGAIRVGHQRLIEDLRKGEIALPPRRFHDELGLYFVDKREALVVGAG